MQALFSFGFFVLGTIVASFVGVLAERVHTGQAWGNSRSRCDSCARELSGLDLIPIVSYLFTFGRCRTCGVRLSLLYLVSEVALATLFVFSYVRFGFTPALGFFLIALSTLLFSVLYDLRHTVVPMEASTVLLFVSLAASFLTSSSLHMFGLTLIIGGIIGLLFFLMYFFSRGKAMGLADAPVALALSLLTGVYAITGLLVSFWIGALVGIVILFRHPRGSRMGIEVPFVPFLAVGYLLVFFIQWILF